MFGVKLTVLCIVITLIMWFMTKVLLANENISTKANIIFHDKYPWYAWVTALLMLLSIIGIVYSVIYMLFLR